MNLKELSLTEIQQGSFEILKKIKEIFDENGWKYYLAYGTLLGAIRHKGFIPWDDDIDIWVPRDDYEKFIDYCQKNPDKLYPFELFHYRTNPKYIYLIARVSDPRYVIEYYNSKEYGLGLFVDVYPLDGVDENNTFYMKKMYKLFRKINIAGKVKYTPSNNILKSIIKFFYFKYLHLLDLNKILIKSDRLVQKYSYNNSNTINCTSWNIGFNYNLKKSYFESGECFKEFNGEMFRVPIEYDKCLKAMYGNYMELPPKEQRVAHHYYRAFKKV